MAHSERMLISPRPPMACSLSLPRTDNSGSPFFEAARGNVHYTSCCRDWRQLCPVVPSPVMRACQVAFLGNFDRRAADPECMPGPKLLAAKLVENVG
jgi:hypothetical protein